MTYALLDDGFYDHPTFIDVDDDLIGVWAKGLAYCNRHLTDGVIGARSIAQKLCKTADPNTIVERMVEAELWALKGDKIIHVGFLDHNRSKREVLKQRTAAKERKNKWKQSAPGTPKEHVPGTRSEHVPGTPEEQCPTQPDPTRSDPTQIREERETAPGAPSPVSDDVRAICEHWLSQPYHGGKRKPVVSEQHRRTVRARLKDGFTVEQLRDAITNAMSDDWLAGKTKDGRAKHGLTEILQNADRINRLCDAQSDELPLGTGWAPPPPDEPWHELLDLPGVVGARQRAVSPGGEG
jgi:hypothetical protein